MKNQLKGALNFYLLLLALFTQLSMPTHAMELEPQITQTLNDEQLVGMVWSTVSGDIVNIGSAGLANVAQSSHMADSQKVQVGSITKTVLALGIMRLITLGELSLDTKVENLLPQLHFTNPWHNTHPVTLQNLLEHTAGLDNIRMWQLLNTKPAPDSPLQTAFPSNNKKLLHIRSQPGAQYSYSNMGYTVLGMVIEAVTGERYEHYLDEHLLHPLGMTGSSFTYLTQVGSHADEVHRDGAFMDGALAMGYFENRVPQAAVPMYLRSAGQFTTTAADMARFMQFLLGDGVLDDSVRVDDTPGGEVFIRAELMPRLATPHQTDAANAGLQAGHGLALATRDRHKVLGQCHPGTTLGFRAYLCLFPEDKKAFFYAINADSETADYEPFNALFIQSLSIKESIIEQPYADIMDVSKLTGVYLPSPNNMAEFEWLDRVFNFKYLSLENNDLVMHALQSEPRTLIPLNHTLLRATDRTKASHVIIINEDRGILLSDGLATFKKQPMLTLIMYWLSLSLGLFGFLYIMLLGGLRIIRRDMAGFKIIRWPFFNSLGFLIPVYLYYQQAFLKFGELTAASFSLALFSGVLPLSVLLSIFFGLRTLNSHSARRDVLALLMLFQWCMVLLYWDMLPLIFWK